MGTDGVEFARVGALEPGQVTRHLDDHDLEPEAQSETGDLALSGELDGVDLPFDGERYSLVVVTSTDKPKALKDFAPVKGWLTGAGFAAHKGDLALPKFSLETSTDLFPLVREDLKDGLKSPTALAEFGSAATIQGILQRTTIDVFEEGAEAAAATAVVVGRSLEVDDTLHMVVDKPYVFALRDRQSGFILAAGYVAKAPKGKGA